MKLLSAADLKKKSPVKWHGNIPEDGISLGVADIDYEGPQGIVDFIKSNLNADFSYYQEKKGLSRSIEIILSFLNSHHIAATPNNIQIIPGTMMGIYASMKYASRREGTIVYAGPLYEPIHRHGLDNHNDVKFAPIEIQGLNHDSMIEAVDNHTKMIAINNPSNPNGYVYTRKDLELIRDLCVDNDITCFADELYQPLVFGRAKNKHLSPITIDGMEDRTISLYGFSKAYGLAGYRSGFMYLGNKVAEEIHHIIEAQMVSPSPITSIVAEWALTSPQSKLWVDEFRNEMENRTKFATNIFKDAGYACQLPDACFFIYPDIGVDDIAFSEQVLKNQGVQVIPGSYFGPTGVNHLRINVATSEERLEEGIKRILKELVK